jgi:hypothetical protein
MSIRVAIAATQLPIAALIVANTPMDRALHFPKLQVVSTSSMVNSLGKIPTPR